MTEERFCNSLPSTPTSRHLFKNDTNRLVNSPHLLEHLSKSQNNTPVKNSPAESFVCSAEAFKRSGPDGSPAFRKTTVNYSRDNIFQPVKSLDFSEILMDSVTDIDLTAEYSWSNMNPCSEDSTNIAHMSPSSQQNIIDDVKENDTDQFEQLSIESDSDQEVLSPLREVHPHVQIEHAPPRIQEDGKQTLEDISADFGQQIHHDMFQPPRLHHPTRENSTEIIRNEAGNIRQPADGYKSNSVDSTGVHLKKGIYSPEEKFSVNVRNPQRNKQTTIVEGNKEKKTTKSSLSNLSVSKPTKLLNTANTKPNIGTGRSGHKDCLSGNHSTRSVGMSQTGGGSNMQKKSLVTSSTVNNSNARKNTSSVNSNQMKPSGKGIQSTTVVLNDKSKTINQHHHSPKQSSGSGHTAAMHNKVSTEMPFLPDGRSAVGGEQRHDTSDSKLLWSDPWKHFSPDTQKPVTSPNEQLRDVDEMENVRGNLQSMLKMSSDVMNDKMSFDYNASVNGLQIDIPVHMGQQQVPGNSQDIQNKPQSEVTELFENFPNLSSQIWTDLSGVDRTDSSIHTENQHLREVLEKERFRRKHCEQHIQQMNGKLLETQQQLAVAVSTDKRKDIMIEQLDKMFTNYCTTADRVRISPELFSYCGVPAWDALVTLLLTVIHTGQLAKVIEGWKKRDSEKDQYIKRIMKEKVDVEETLRRQQQMVTDFEKELHNTVEELRKEKENSSVMIAQLKLEARERQDEAEHMVELLNAEKEQGQLTKQEYDRLKEFREISEQKTQQLQDKLHKEQDKWFEREQELLKKIDDISEVHLKTIQEEKRKLSEEEISSREAREKLQQVESENKKILVELDCVMREKESLKVEMSIMEAKFESAQRKIEADLHSEMEKQIADQVSEVHQQALKNEEKILETHRQQIQDIANRQAQDLERHLKQFQEELKRKEGEFRKEIQDMEDRLAEYRNENTKLRHTKQKLESQKMEILTKLQYMMQSQWQEAVTLFGNTPMKSRPADHHSTSLFTIPLTSNSISSISTITQPIVSSNTISSSNGNGNFNSHPLPQTSSPSKESTLSNFTVGSEQLNQKYFDSRHPDLSKIDSSIDMQRYFESLTHHAANGDTDVINQNSTPPRINKFHSIPHSQGYEINGANFLDVLDIQDDFKAASHENHNKNDTSDVPSQMQNMNYQSVSNLSHQVPVAIPIRPPQQMTAPNHSDPERKGSSGFVTSEPVGVKHVAFLNVAQNPSDWSDSDSIDSQKMVINQESLLQRVGMSPPVKQSRTRNREDMSVQNGVDDSFGNLSEALVETERLNANYSHLSDKLEEHQSRQSELQHYIQMLLDRSPGRGSQDNEPYEEGSDLAETVDLNDTAQAAQLHRELRRLQQLRQMEEQAALKAKKQEVAAQHLQMTVQKQVKDIPGVLSGEQLSAISTLLDQVKGNAETQPVKEDTEQAAIIQMLKTMQTRSDNLVEQSEKEVSSANRVNKNDTDSKKAKRNLNSKSNQSVESGVSSSKSEATKQLIRKNERKIASAKTAVNKANNVWK